jgi:hypothetical protein
MKKSLVEKRNKTHYIFAERNTLIEVRLRLSKLSHPFIIHMHAAFQSEKKFYFIL